MILRRQFNTSAAVHRRIPRQSQSTDASSSTPIASTVVRALFPSTSVTSASTSSMSLATALRQRRRGVFHRSNIAFDAVAGLCGLQFATSVGHWVAGDPALADELHLMLLADSNSSNSNSSDIASSSAATPSSLNTEFDMSTVLVSVSPLMRDVVAALREVADVNRDNSSSSVDAITKTATTPEQQYIRVLASTAAATSIGDAATAQLLAHSSSSSSTMIPPHLYPALLAYSSPSICLTLIKNDVIARLRKVNNNNNTNSLAPGDITNNQPDDNPGRAKAPIDPVLFFRLFGSLLRNQTLSREELFAGGHRALLALVTSYSAQIPNTGAFSALEQFVDGVSLGDEQQQSSSSSSSDAITRNIVAMLLIRVSRLYGRPARALEFAELHGALSDSVPWMLHLAPALYWTWLLGSTVDAARSSDSFARLLPPLMTPQDACKRDLDVEALSKLWAAFVPHLEEAVGVASRLNEDFCRKVRTTCIKVALLLDENDAIVGQQAGHSRVAAARRCGVPLSFQRLLHVYNVWGYHTVFSSGHNAIDTKDAASQAVRLFGVALRRGAASLMIEHPAEYEGPLLGFIETVFADKPFGVIEATGWILGLLAEQKSIIDSTSSSSSSQSEQQEASLSAGITSMGRRVHEWAQALLKSQGGGWDTLAISPIADALEKLKVIPPAPFWWRCGCGAKNPSTSIRCTSCLRRDAASASHWTCPGLGCGARQFVRFVNVEETKSRAAQVQQKCQACGTQHPWMTELQRTKGDTVACSLCLEVQPLPHFSREELSSKDEDLLLHAMGDPSAPKLLDLCATGKCKTLAFNNNNSEIDSGGNSQQQSNFVPKHSRPKIVSPMSDNKHKAGGGGGVRTKWTCSECATETTSMVACPSCGLLKDATADARMWCCDDCGSWNFSGTSRCHRYGQCSGKKRSGQRPVPYIRWRCGCGAHNPMWRLSCGRCCGISERGGHHNNSRQQQQQQQQQSSGGGASQFTCPTCRTIPPRLVSRELSPLHAARPAMKIHSCGQCGADHPRDLAIVRGITFERPCVSCGDWHTLAGYSPTAAPSRTVCCSHCGCENDASAEPFARWNCETCSYEESKRKTAASLAQNSSSNNNSTATSSNSNATAERCWRTGYRCKTCGDLHPALSFSVVRTGIAARLPGCSYDGVFLWKCQAEAGKGNKKNDSTHQEEHEAAEEGMCCGAFNPSWETQCSSCGQTRFHTSATVAAAVGASSSKQQQLKNAKVGIGEIRARYVPWSCESCGELRAPEDVLYCPSCLHPRTPPPCATCGGHHIACECPEQQQQQSLQSNNAIH